MNDLNALLLALVAGGTIFLGLPVAFLGGAHARLRSLLTAFSVGVLVYLLIEIGAQVLEQGEVIVGAARLGKISLPLALELFVPLVVGIAGGFWALVWFDRRFIKNAKDEEVPADRRAQHLALMVATGIGLHNLSEGLAIGAAYASGAMALAQLLIVGFALHNATEGFGIAGPLGGTKPSIRYVALLGCIGGLPTMFGTLLGLRVSSPLAQLVFLAMASGSILYVVGELLHLGRHRGAHEWVMGGLLLGFFTAYGTELVLAAAAPDDDEQSLFITYPTERPSPEHGAELFAELCVTCHGPEGNGQGPAAADLPRRPADLTDPMWIVMETDQDWYDVITYGRRPVMPPWKDHLSDRDRWDLVAFLRTLGTRPRPMHSSESESELRSGPRPALRGR
ncbi:MAG: c-type cytochrome [Nitrospirae bacterium]|nr:c-type cytochrome [Nitrospirota bacterium]